MKYKKGVVVTFLISLLSLLTACTATGLPSGIEIWNKILWFGSLGWLGHTDNPMAGFMRIMIFILVFAILYELANLTGFLGRNVAITIALVISLISAVFIPGSVLAGIGAAYGTIVALFLIGLPVVGGLYGFFRIPTTTRFHRFMRLVVLLILLAVLIAVKNHAVALGAIGPQTINFP